MASQAVWDDGLKKRFWDVMRIAWNATKVTTRNQTPRIDGINYGVLRAYDLSWIREYHLIKMIEVK